jgi:hypothetical protein
MLRWLAAVVLVGVLAVAPGCGARSAPPSIRITSWDVVGQSVVLYVHITGWRMAAPHIGPIPKPRTGQWQIFVDRRYAGFSYDKSIGTINGLSAGTYHVWVALARTDYTLVYPLIRSPSVLVRIGDSGDY